MSIYAKEIDIDDIATVVEPDGAVVVTYNSVYPGESWEGIRISTPEEAQRFRSEVNKAVEMFMGPKG